MKENSKLVPEIRFSGFTDAWEQRKIDEFSKEKYGGGTPKTIVEEYWNGDIDWIQSSDLTNNKVFDVIARKHVTKEGIKRSATKLVPANSIAIVTRVGFGKLTFMPNEYATSQDFLSLSSLNFESKFSVYSLFNKLQNELNAVQGTSIKGITKEELLNKNIMVPIDNDEQTKIGAFFKQLDDIIALNNRKYDALKQLKSGYLAQIFSQNLRFSGFLEDWEVRRLGETDTLFTDGNYGESYPSPADMSSKKEGGIPFLRGSNFFNGYLDESRAKYITPEKHSTLVSGHIEKDDIILVVRGSLGTLGYAKSENVGWNINSQLAILRTDKSELDGIFLVQFLRSRNGQKELLSRNTGTALKQLPLKQLKDVPVPFTDLYEQKKIGILFQRLDFLITQQETKVNALKEIKQAYLQKIFI